MAYQEASTAMWNSDDPVVKALAVTGYNIGLSPDENGKDICIHDRFMDAYLAAIVLAQRIAAGDMEIVEKGDSVGQKEYLDRLLKSCTQLDIKTEQQAAENR